MVSRSPPAGIVFLPRYRSSLRCSNRLLKKIINRLGIVHYSTPPIIGGVEEVVKYHSRLFLDDGYYIRIITGEGERFDPDIDLVIIPELRARLRSGFCEDLKMKILESLNKVITDLDLLIVHNIMTMPLNISLTAAIADLAQNIPIIAWTHDLAIFDPNYQFPKDEYPWSLITRRNEGMTYVVISDYRKEQLEELFGDSNSIVIPNGVDLFRISGCDTELTMVIEPLIYKGAIGLMPGRLVRRKNFEFAIRIIAALNRRMSSTLLLTAPVDPHNPDTVNYHNELKKLIGEMGIGDKVIFLSERIDLSDWGRVRTLYTIADFLLLTSRIEGFGLPV
ncbi:MAG TPA: glycosyltransferase, partial [bacterium (Candidatus Stahlbacteria)]|nr:glycosyltransferase [Candidatus Stahlbacteria bacterium]